MVNVPDTDDFEQMKQQLTKIEALLLQLVNKPVTPLVKSKSEQLIF